MVIYTHTHTAIQHVSLCVLDFKRFSEFGFERDAIYMSLLLNT